MMITIPIQRSMTSAEKAHFEEREMLSKIEELRNALDEAKEEKYNLRLQLTKLQK